MAAWTACWVISWKATRCTALFFKSFLSFSISKICQEIASPSLSGSVARYKVSALFMAVVIALRYFAFLAMS